MKNYVENKINESPDHVRYVDDNNEVQYSQYDDGDAFPFVVDIKHKKAYIGNKEVNNTHYYLIIDIVKKIESEQEENFLNIDITDWQGIEKLKDYLYNESFLGRVWLNKKIISFYDIPNKHEMKTVVNLLQSIIQKEKGINVNLYDFYLDTGVENNDGYDIIKPLIEYVGGQKRIETQNTKQIPHFMDYDDKRNNPDIWGYVQRRRELDAEKLLDKNGKEMSRAEYNALRRPYSESKLIDNEPMLDNETIEDYFNRMARKLVWRTEKFKKDKELHTNGTPEEKKEKYGGYNTNRYNNLSKKLGNMPEVEYNFYKKYGIGDSKSRKQLVLSEGELYSFINKKTREIVNEMKYNTIYNIVKKCMNESLIESNEENQIRDTVRQLIRENFYNGILPSLQ